jgi:hypothetical protein
VRLREQLPFLIEEELIDVAAERARGNCLYKTGKMPPILKGGFPCPRSCSRVRMRNRCVGVSTRSRGGFLIRHELIPHAVDGEDVLRLFDVVLDLLAQPRDVVIHRTSRGVGIIAPHLIEELVAGNDRAALSD